MTDGSSLSEAAFAFLNTGFFNKFLTVLMTLSAFEEPLSVNLEYC